MSALVQVTLKLVSGNSRHDGFAHLEFDRLDRGERLTLFVLGAIPAAWMILQNSRELPSAMGGSFASSSTMALSISYPARAAENVLHGVDFDISFGQSRGPARLADVFDARLNFRFSLQIHAPETNPVVRGRRQKGHIDPIATVKANAGKAGRPIKRLLVEHVKLDKKPLKLARLDLHRFCNYIDEVSWFTDRHFFLLAVVVYGLSSAYSVFLWRKGFRKDDRVNYLLLLLAATLHTVAMVKRGFNIAHCPVNNLYEATTFIAWTIVVAYLSLGSSKNFVSLGAFASHVLLSMGVFALMPALDPPMPPSPIFLTASSACTPPLFSWPSALSGLSAVAALMFLTEEHDLKFHKLRAFFPSCRRSNDSNEL